MDKIDYIYFDTLLLKPMLQNYKNEDMYDALLHNTLKYKERIVASKRANGTKSKDGYAEIPKTGYSKMPLNYIMPDVIEADMNQSGMTYEEHMLLSLIGAYHCSFVSQGKELTPKAILDNVVDIEYLELKELIDSFGFMYGLSWRAVRVGARRKVNIVLDREYLSVNKREQYRLLGLIVDSDEDNGGEISVRKK